MATSASDQAVKTAKNQQGSRLNLQQLSVILAVIVMAGIPIVFGIEIYRAIFNIPFKVIASLLVADGIAIAIAAVRMIRTNNSLTQQLAAAKNSTAKLDLGSPAQTVTRTAASERQPGANTKV